MSEQERNESQQAEPQQPEIEDLEVTAEESDDVKGGGKVSMNDFHFVTKTNKSSP